MKTRSSVKNAGYNPSFSEPEMMPSNTTSGRILKTLSKNEAVSAAEIEQQRVIADERDEAITQIVKDVEITNEIFRDLAGLLTAQSDLVDNIEKNLSQTAENTQKGVKELEKAAQYQRACVLS